MPNNDYIYRINKVIDYVQTYPEADLSLYNLAKVASFSPFHFHRIFKAILGESVNDYVKRSRLEGAAKRLVANNKVPITTIALDVGFTSSAVFSRAFKDYFGLAASEFRRKYHNSKNCKGESNHCKEITPLSDYNVIGKAAAKLKTENKRSEIAMNVEVKILPTYHVAYVRHLEGYDKGVYNLNISSAFDKTAMWVEARQLFDKNTLCIGAFYDYQEITPSEKRRYDAALTIPTHVTEGSEGISIKDISGGQYAICRIELDNENKDSFERAINEMDRGFEYIYGTWLPNSMYELEDKACLELYLSSKESKKTIIEACVPINAL